MKTAAAFAFITLFSLNSTVSASNQETLDPQEYLRAESLRIVAEGDRIKREGDKLYAEAARLSREARELRKNAARLDALWDEARNRNPGKHRDYAGRDKSQRKMRVDALREDRDASKNRADVRQLYDEAARLWRLAGAVNPQAQKDLIDRIRNCCKPEKAISLLRARIVMLARRAGLSYVPR